MITDESFDDTSDVGSIRYRLHPIDVGFDLREDGLAISIASSDDPIRVSYPDRDGDRRVMAGPQGAVLERLRKLGFSFVVETRK